MKEIKKQPIISVIVPAYNVERYLRECLDSIANQTIAEQLEVIMVDDGALDTTGEIMDEYAEKYVNFFAYHKENGGLGNARNYGIQFVTGDYLAFVDSDDYLSLDAYEKMLDMALKNDTDMVVGNAVRFNSRRKFVSALHKKAFLATKPVTHIFESPELLNDATAWNKLIRTSFWRAHNFQFPEGMLYEDIPVAIKAHILAKSVSIFDEVIYYWRDRDPNEVQSISQQRLSVDNLVDKVKALNMVCETIKEQKSPHQIKVLFDYKILTHDLPLFTKWMLDGTVEYQNTLVQTMKPLIDQAEEEAFEKISAIEKMRYHYISELNVEKTKATVLFEATKIQFYSPEKRGKEYYAVYPFSQELPEKFSLMGAEFEVRKKIEKLHWLDSSTLCIEGYQYIKLMNMAHKEDVQCFVCIKNPTTGKVIATGEVETFQRKDVTKKFGVPKRKNINIFSRVTNYDWSGFVATISIDRSKMDENDFQNLEIQMTLNVQGLQREYILGEPVSKDNRGYSVLEDLLILPNYNIGNWNLRLTVERAHTFFTKSVVLEDRIRIYGKTDLAIGKETKILLKNIYNDKEKVFSIFPQEEEGFYFDLAKQEITEEMFEGLFGEWIVYFYQNKEKLLFLKLNPKEIEIIDINDKKDLVIESISEATTRLKLVEKGVLLGSLEMEKGILDVQVFSENPQIEMDENAKLVFAYQTETSPQTAKQIPLITKTVKSGSNKTYHGRLNFSQHSQILKEFYGSWVLFLVSETAEGEIYYPVRFTKKDFSFPEYQGYRNSKVSFGTMAKSRAFILTSRYKWSWVSDGGQRREFLRERIYPLMQKCLPMNKKKIIFSSYWGTQASCSPFSMYEYIEKNYPEYKNIWTLHDMKTNVAGSAVRVKINTFRYFYHMATAKYFVNNVNFPDFYEKREGAVEVQTMHGTPLKTMGLDVPGEVGEIESEPTFLRRCNRWDFLTIPSDYVGEIVKRAFRYDKKLLTIGYPRNDFLFEKNNPNEIDKIKEKLGLPKDKKIILYAPTWRFRGSLYTPLQLEKLQKSLGEEYILLVRIHYFSTSTNMEIKKYAGFAYDMSKYGDIRELYVISDILMTDYSSVMFDYAVLKRPMLFFTYDYENYKNELRGMYFDFEKEAPSKLLRTTEEVIDEVKDIDHYFDKYQEKYAAFTKKYNQYDKGNASELATKSMLGKE